MVPEFPNVVPIVVFGSLHVMAECANVVSGSPNVVPEFPNVVPVVVCECLDLLMRWLNFKHLPMWWLREYPIMVLESRVESYQGWKPA